MKARYEFENEIIKEYGDAMEPIQQGYNVDDLKAEDRAFVGGVLWALNQVETSRLNYGEDYEKKETVLNKLKEEIIDDFCDELKNDLLSEVSEITLSCIDDYEEEENEGN